MKKNFVKKCIQGITLLAICISISGCGHEHVWQEANCTTPKNCTECGKTEGEAIGHTLTEGNYQQAAICIVCGETDGQPLQADFEKYGLECNVELNKIYDAVTLCQDDETKTTDIKVVFSNYKIFDSDETHPAKEGYEWRTVEVAIFWHDDNYSKYSAGRMLSLGEDYYDVVAHDESIKEGENGATFFTVNYNGIEYSECQEYGEVIRYRRYRDNTSFVHVYSMGRLVPKGYDGSVYGIGNPLKAPSEGQHIFDIDNTDTLFFRFANLEDIKEYSANDISEINLTKEIGTKVIQNFYMNMLNYFDEETIGYFDFDGNMNISQSESAYILTWALDNYNVERSSVLSEEATIKAASDYLAGKLNVPDSLYLPTDDASNKTGSNSNASGDVVTSGPIAGEVIINRGENVTGWETVQMWANMFGVPIPIDDCYQTESGVYVVAKGWVCKFFDGNGNTCDGQVAFMNIGVKGTPHGDELKKLEEGVHFWKAE